jgi:peptide subunit release factor 1 (eRF1)
MNDLRLAMPLYLECRRSLANGQCSPQEEYARQRRTEERERCEEQAAVDQIRAEMQREVANLRAEMLREREFVLEVVGTAIGEFSNKRAFAIALALGGVPGSGNSDGSLLN